MENQETQEPIPNAGAEADAEGFTGAITDGSQALAHDGHDVETFSRAAQDFTRLGRTVEKAGQTLHIGPALMRDLFWSFYKRSPRIAPVAPLCPAHEINRQILEQIFSTGEWREMREGGTVADPLASAMATIGASRRAIAALDAETIRRINELHELSAEVEALFERAETLKDLASLSPDSQQARSLSARAEQAEDEAARKERRAGRVGRGLESELVKLGQQVRQSARQGLAEALREIEQTNEAIKAFGGGYEMGFGTGNADARQATFSMREKLAIAQQVGRSPKLQRIAAVCGRFTRIALRQQKSRVQHPPDEIASITAGNQIERLLPGEIVLLTEPELEDIFFLKFAERSLMQYDLIGHEPQGQGPIILAVDESGSMAEPPGGLTGEVWSKAVMLALLSIARLQKRDFAVIHFSGPDELKVDIFPKGEATPGEVIVCSSFFYGGGTAFEPWMDKALELVADSRFEKADVICVSDGVTSVSAGKRDEWAKKRADHGMRAYGILIGAGEGGALLRQLTDAVFRLDDLRDDLPALETIFSI